MRNPKFVAKEAAFLARAARDARLVTYGEFAGQFGYANQGCGATLTQMGERLKANAFPLLPVLVVNKSTEMPSADAEFYRRLGLSQADLKSEQERCFSFDWTKAPFWEENI